MHLPSVSGSAMASERVVVDAAATYVSFPCQGHNHIPQLTVESSSSDDVSSNSSTAGSKQKRRSHRPRGCRGGRKNRKNQLAKATALLPKEILDIPSLPISPKNKKTSRTEGQRSDVVILKRNKDPHELIKPVGGLPFMNHNSTSVGAAFSSPAHPFSHNIHYQQKGKGSIRDQQKIDKVIRAKHMFRPLQDSNGHFLLQKPIEEHFGSFSLSEQNEILPPLPVIPSPVEAVPQEGPNPYALSTDHAKLPTNKSTDTNIAHYMYSNNKGNKNINIRVMGSSEYRARRIQKQRQMLADGGSLFLTSPRSFLLGRSQGTTKEEGW